MIWIDELYDDARAIVEECCGDVIEDIETVSINYRSKKRWGCCKRRNGINHIEISNRILRDDIPYEKVLTVMIHEILHATYGGHSHGKVWQERAQKVMAKYPEYKITRCTPASEFGLEARKVERKFAVQCPVCKKRVSEITG